MSPEEWLASQATPAAPAAPVAAPGMPGARVTPTEQAARDQEAIPILMQELQAAQGREQAGNPRAAGDVVAIVKELARKGVNVDIGALPSISAASAPAAPAPAAAPASAPVSPEAWLASQTPAAPVKPPQLGFFEGLVESVTGSRRSASPEVAAALAEKRTIYDMPEANQMSFGLLKAALGGLMAGSEERAKIFAANFPGLTYRLDQQGTVFLRSPTDGKEYVIEPGLTARDIPRGAATAAAFTPAGRAATIPGAIIKAGATQTAIEASQAATGGGTGLADVGEVALAGALGPAGQLIQRAVPPVVQAVKGGAQRVMARPAPAPAAPRVEPTYDELLARLEIATAPPGPFSAKAAPPVMPEAPPAAAPPVPPTAAAPTAAAAAPTVTTTVTTETINNLVQKASGKGFGSTAARDQLADLAQVNVAAKEAADRLGIQLPADVFSDNPQVRAAAGLTRSLAAGEAEAAWRTTVSQAVDKADDVIRKFDATFVEGAVAPGVVSQKIKDSLTKTRADLNAQASKVYDAVDEVVPKTSIVDLPKLGATLDAIKAEVGEKGMSAAERNLAKMIEDGNVTYGRLKREKTLIGKALNKMESPYGSMAEADLKRLYAALADDQLTNVGNIGGEELRQQLRGANLIYAKERALGNRIVNAFGNDLEGSIANKMRTAITGAAKGDAGEFNRLLKTVPEDLRKETLATALASVTRSARGAEKGGFGFSEFADIYPKLRANPPVYKTIVDTLGKDSANVLRDLFEVSKRITEARANVLTTGKANQAFGNPEGLIGKIMESSITQRIVTTVTGMVPGGGAVAPDIIKFMATGAEDRVKAAGKLFADEAFQKLAVEAATKAAPSAATLRRTAMSQSFQKFADAAKLPKGLDARIQFLQSAAQTGRQFDQENQ